MRFIDELANNKTVLDYKFDDDDRESIAELFSVLVDIDQDLKRKDSKNAQTD